MIMRLSRIILTLGLGAALAACGSKSTSLSGAPTPPGIKTTISQGPDSGTTSASGSASDKASGDAPGSGTATGTGTDVAAATGTGTASDEVIQTAGTDEPEVVINLEAVEGAAMQVKNINLLRSSITECLDMEPGNTDIFSIKLNMKVGNLPADAIQGKVQFYKGSCEENIIGCLKSDLYDPESVAGDTVSSNALSVNYLQALGTVANVIAHNCDTATKCKCDDPAVAEGLIKRCVPYLTDSDFDKAKDYLVQTCKATTTAEGDANRARRMGIANLIGSVGFAKARE